MDLDSLYQIANGSDAPNWTALCHYFDEIFNGSVPENFSYRAQCRWDDSARLEIGTNQFVQIPMYVVIFIVCVVGNTLVIVTLLQNRKMRTVTNIFLINLSVGDLLLGVFCMPFTLTGQYLKRFIFGAVLCKIVPYFQVVSVAVSTFTLVSISIERLFAICYPLTSRRWQTVSHSIKMTIICWILAFIVAFPVMFYSRYTWYRQLEGVDYYYCREVFPSIDEEKAYNLFLLVVLFGLPGIFMTIAYAKITASLYKGIKGESQSSSKESYASNGTLAKFSMKFARMRANSASERAALSRNGSTTTCSAIQRSSTADDLDNMDTPMVTSPGQTYNPQTPSPVHGVRSTHTERNLAAKKRVILMLVIVVLEFFVCFTPLWIINTVGLFDRDLIINRISDLGMLYLQLLMYISTCCNPITYCFLHSKFRQGFIQAFRCGKQRQEISDLTRTRTSRPVSYRKSDNVRAAAAVISSNRNVRICWMCRLSSEHAPLPPGEHFISTTADSLVSFFHPRQSKHASSKCGRCLLMIIWHILWSSICHRGASDVSHVVSATKEMPRRIHLLFRGICVIWSASSCLNNTEEIHNKKRHFSAQQTSNN
ncbi:cholecystokinin receptor type A-like isoform X2 [Paramacrobiotus metropolitanus]|uniref:cholecystokinin receptor type A-like isoform X2 n=1 Tax=Paramacrobiotus metropolitanus TaxID=2943436 RepID=UPI002445EF67|nr:cholecystokinin receptor type A-like isoform X2 [Paramacrobiotus metropolitanus]